MMPDLDRSSACGMPFLTAKLIGQIRLFAKDDSALGACSCATKDAVRPDGNARKNSLPRPIIDGYQGIGVPIAYNFLQFQWG
jgi:hypothetical protein